MTFRKIRETYLRFSFLRKGGLKSYVTTGGFDGVFLTLLIIILITGLVMMFSASYVYSWYNSPGNDPYFIFFKQLKFAIIGIVLMFIVSYIRFDVVEDFSVVLLILSIFMLVYVLINPYVIPGKEDFKRWFSVPFIGTVQPSEIAKVALIIYLAWSLSKRRLQVEKDNDRIPTVVHAFIICLVCGLVYLENHLSAVIIIFAIGIVMMFFGGTNARVFALGAAFLVIAVFVALKTGVLKDYAGQRIDVWQKLLHNEQLTAQEEQGEGWQILQSLYAIGSGGMFGMGFGNSKQKHLYLPEPQNDFIFAIVCEELGYIRAIIIMLLFLLLVLRGFYIALHHKNRFAQLLVLGICFQLGLEAGLNIAVVTGTVPNTGIALPFFSSGGSALLTLLVEMGMVLSVSRTMDKKTKKVKEEVEAVNGNS